MFKDAALAMEISPTKKGTTTKSFSLGVTGSPNKSPGKDSVMSKGSSQMTGILSPGRASKILDIHKKTGVELRESPSKAAKIILRYINNYADVGPII